MLFTNNIDPILVSFGPFTIHWYGLCFALGVLSYYLLISYIFKKQKYPESDLDGILIYLFLGLIIGARLGHVLFYNFEYFSKNPLEIFQIWNGGLASHGAAIGIFFSYLLWLKIKKKPFGMYMDVFVLPMPLTAAFVRLGNFFNSEIIGTPTNGDYGVIFAKLGEDFPRHPAMLYEGLMSLFVFAILFYLYKKSFNKRPKYFFVSLYILLYFGGRFITEIWKDRFSPDNTFFLSPGQLLSIIPILLGAYYFLFYFRKRN